MGVGDHPCPDLMAATPALHAWVAADAPGATLKLNLDGIAHPPANPKHRGSRDRRGGGPDHDDQSCGAPVSREPGFVS